MWDIFLVVLNEALKKFVPEKTRRSYGRTKPLWWNKDVYRVRKNRLKWWNRYNESHFNHDYVKFENDEREASKLVKKAKRDLERKIVKTSK